MQPPAKKACLAASPCCAHAAPCCPPRPPSPAPPPQFKGRGHEASDLRRLLEMYKRWQVGAGAVPAGQAQLEVQGWVFFFLCELHSDADMYKRWQVGAAG